MAPNFYLIQRKLYISTGELPVLAAAVEAHRSSSDKYWCLFIQMPPTMLASRHPLPPSCSPNWQGSLCKEETQEPQPPLLKGFQPLFPEHTYTHTCARTHTHTHTHTYTHTHIQIRGTSCPDLQGSGIRQNKTKPLCPIFNGRTEVYSLMYKENGNWKILLHWNS